MINLPTISQHGCTNPPSASTNCPDMGSDPRCSDPVFAQANPSLCPSGVIPPAPTLILKPSTVIVCPTTTTQLSAYAAINGAEQPITSGVTYTSSHPDVATVNASTGLVTGVASGIVTITAQWQGLSAYSQITIVGTGTNCCDDIKVATFLVIDRSLSMSLPFDLGYATKLAYEKALAADYVSGLNVTKDLLGVIQFSDSVEILQGLTNDTAVLTSAVNGITQDNDFFSTNILGGIKTAYNQLANTVADVKVIVLLSDGNLNNPPYLQSAGTTETLAEADSFKQGGGIIVCVGIRAASDGYMLMSRIASPGYFLNAIPDNDTESFTDLSGLKGYFCAGACNVSGYGTGCLSSGPSSQVPDPNPQADNETQGSVTPPPVPPNPFPPQSPMVAFTPASGALSGSGLSVTLSCPGYPNALIRYTLDGSNPPPDPSFTFPSSIFTGVDYDGSHVPINIGATSSPNLPRIKAICRVPGFADSEISEASYPPT